MHFSSKEGSRPFERKERPRNSAAALGPCATRSPVSIWAAQPRPPRSTRPASAPRVVRAIFTPLASSDERRLEHDAAIDDAGRAAQERRQRRLDRKSVV